MECRKIGDYTILTSFHIGVHEIALCENKNAPKDEVYLCGNIENNGVFERLTDCLASESFADVASCYGERIAEKAEETQKEIETREKRLGVDEELTSEDCRSITHEDSLKGKIIVIRGEALRPEFRRASYQLMYCTGGFGAQPNARGRSCFGINLYDGSKTDCRRDEVLGILPEDRLCEWEKDNLEKVKCKQIERKEEARCVRG